MTVAKLNGKVASKLHIPEGLLSIEDANGTGTEFSYRIR